MAELNTDEHIQQGQLHLVQITIVNNDNNNNNKSNNDYTIRFLSVTKRESRIRQNRFRGKEEDKR